MKNQQNNTSALSALLRTANGGDTLETNSLCCAAAGIIAPPSATAEALIPHEKLRGAAPSDATLTAQKSPPAQPAEEGKKALALTINFAKEPVFLTEVLQVSVDDAEDVSNRQNIHAIGNHHYCSRRVQRVPSSRNPCPSRKSSKPNGGRLDRFIGMTIWGVVFEGVRDLTTYREVRASIPQIQLEVFLSRLLCLLTFPPNRTLRLISAVPDPFTNVERREGAVDCKITRRGKGIHRIGDVTTLQLTYLPVQLQQHVVDTFHLKRVHRLAPFYPHFASSAPAHRRGAGIDQYTPSVRSMSHDSSLRRGKI